MPSIDQILRERRAAAKRRGPTPAQELARFNRARETERRRRTTRTTTTTTQDPTRGGGGFGPTLFSQTEAGLAAQQASSLRLLEIQRVNQETIDRRQQRNSLALQASEQAFLVKEAARQRTEDAAIRRKELARQRTESINALKVEREGIFSQLIKSGDQVRAVLFALGFGPESDQFTTRAQALDVRLNPLKGARKLETSTEEALSRVLGRTVDIGREGVRGLGSAFKSARAFAQGGADVQTLLTSAFGVGSLREGEQPGFSAARLQELTRQVTPMGVL